MALLATLYENYTRDRGTAAVSIRQLAARTHLHIRTVRVVVDDLRALGVLVEVEAAAGKTRKLRLQPSAQSAHSEDARNPRTPFEHESAHTPDRKRAGSMPTARTVPSAQSAHTTNEKEFLEEVLKKDRGQAPNGQNGHRPSPGEEQRAAIAAKAATLARRLSMGRPPQPVYEQQPAEPERDPDDDMPEPDPDDALVELR